jgi:hypothetical protein
MAKNSGPKKIPSPFEPGLVPGGEPPHPAPLERALRIPDEP